MLRVEFVQLSIGVVDGVNDVEQHTGAAGTRQQLEVAGAQIHKGEDLLVWLNEDVLAGMAEAGLEKFPADLGFTLGSATARFRRIAREGAEADGHADSEEVEVAEAALRAIADVLMSPRST